MKALGNGDVHVEVYGSLALLYSTVGSPSKLRMLIVSSSGFCCNFSFVVWMLVSP